MAEKTITTEYSKEMQKSYVNYSMSVITARAVPNARDGLKPIQRRVLYDMSELHTNYDKPHRKSARIVGDTMGKYHPHGDSSIYETLAVMSQVFKKGMPLVNGHGNFGSIEGGGAAVMRYMETHPEKFAEGVYLRDSDKTVDLVSNHDETEKESKVFPVRVSNLLINGAEGVAAGTSTSIPPYNLGEVIDAVMAYIDKPEIVIQELTEYLSGPDFLTGGIIANESELAGIYETGSGGIKLHGKLEVELGKRESDKDKLVIAEIPYTIVGVGINKYLVDITRLVGSKKLTDVVDISNQSNRESIRIVLELEKGADTEKVINILYKETELEDVSGVNMLAIAGGRPETPNLKGILRNYLELQYQNIIRKCRAFLEKELEKKEIREGLTKVCDVTDLIIAILRGPKNLKGAKTCLMNGDISNIKFRTLGFEEDVKELQFMEKRASAIPEMRPYKLTGLGILALEKEYKETLKKIKEHTDILESKRTMDGIIKEDLTHIKEESAALRGVAIEDGKEAACEEAPVEVQEVAFIMDRLGYYKLLDKNIHDRNREVVGAEHPHVVVCMDTDKICLFTNLGNLHQVRATEIPLGKLRDKGTPIDNLSKFDGMKEEIICLTNLEGIRGKKLVFATEMALVKQVPTEEFETNNRMVAAIKLQDGGGLVSVQIVGQQTEVVLQTSGDVSLRLVLDKISEVRKNSRGVHGIKLATGEELGRLYPPGEESVTMYKKKGAHLNRLKIGKRDGKGSKVQLN